MVVKADLTQAQARDLYFYLKNVRRGQDVSPLSRAFEKLEQELEVHLEQGQE